MAKRLTDQQGVPTVAGAEAIFAATERSEKRRVAVERVRETFAAWKAAITRVHRCHRPATLDAARAAMQDAERQYREAAAERDRIVKEERGGA